MPITWSTCSAFGPASWWWPPTGPARGSRAGWPGGRAPAPAGTHPVPSLEVDGRPTHQARTEPAITVAFAPTKGERPEWVTQKLTELGVDRIVPIQTGRSVVRWEGERGAGR